MSHALALSPGGHLFVQPDEQAEPKLSQAAAGRLTEGFAAAPACGLEMLASAFLHEPLPPSFVFWRGLAQRLFTELCHNPDLQNAASISIPKPLGTEWSALAETAPPMRGFEYLNGAVLARLWDGLDAHVRAAIAQTPGGAVAYLKSCHPVWNAVGRVTFHLAENKRNPAYPFAFLATYTHRISEQGKVHICPWAVLWRNMPGRRIEPRWLRYCRQCSARRSGANWPESCWSRAPCFIPKSGGPSRRFRFWRTFLCSSKAAWWFEFRIGGRRAVRPDRR